MITKPEKIIVGVRGGVFCEETRPLGFMKQLKGQPAADKKAEVVIDCWTRTPHSAITFDNDPTSGFKVKGFASRYSTSNKLLEVSDPRGFTVQLPISSAVEMIQDTTIINGDIQGECVWYFSGAEKYLVSTSSEMYTQMNNKISDQDSWKAFVKANKTTLRKSKRFDTIYKTTLGNEGCGEECMNLGKVRVNYFTSGYVRPSGYGPREIKTSEMMACEGWAVANLTYNGQIKIFVLSKPTSGVFISKMPEGFINDERCLHEESDYNLTISKKGFSAPDYYSRKKFPHDKEMFSASCDIVIDSVEFLD